MKARTLVIAAVAAGLLMLAAVASAKTTLYRGPVKPSGRLSFKLTEKHGSFHIRNGFTFAVVPLHCTNGKRHTSGHLKFPVKVHRHRFVAVAQANGGAAKLTVKGYLNRSLKRARGTIRIRGTKVPLDSGGTGDCDSGTRHFTARRL